MIDQNEGNFLPKLSPMSEKEAEAKWAQSLTRTIIEENYFLCWIHQDKEWTYQ